MNTVKSTVFDTIAGTQLTVDMKNAIDSKNF